jgi:uncharacterized protein with HEPN domain
MIFLPLMRVLTGDVIPHHYFDLNAEAVFGICKNHIPGMAAVINTIINDLDNRQPA